MEEEKEHEAYREAGRRIVPEPMIRIRACVAANRTTMRGKWQWEQDFTFLRGRAKFNAT